MPRTVTLSDDEVSYLCAVFSELEHYMWIGGCADDDDSELYESLKEKLIGD